MFSFLLLPFVLLGCTEAEICELVGSYTGTFTGDAEGNVDIEVTDADGVTLIDVTIQNDTVAALGSGEVNCEDGAFAIDLETDAGEALGAFEGAVAEGSGDGTWEFTATDLAGLAGTWQVAQ